MKPEQKIAEVPICEAKSPVKFSIKTDIDLVAVAGLALNIIIVILVTIIYNKKFSNRKTQKELIIAALREHLSTLFGEKERLEEMAGLYWRASELVSSTNINPITLKEIHDRTMELFGQGYSDLTQIKNQRNYIFHLIDTSSLPRKLREKLKKIHAEMATYVTSPLRSTLSQIRTEAQRNEWMLQFTKLSDENMRTIASLINEINIA